MSPALTGRFFTTEPRGKPKSWFFEKINKTDKSLSRHLKKKRERTQINKIKNEKREVTINTTEIQRIIEDYYKQLYAEKWTTWKKWTYSLERYNFLRQSVCFLQPHGL